jgi:type II secretory pathway component PulM
VYLTRTSLEVHLSKVHAGLAPRERSNLLAATLNMVV